MPLGFPYVVLDKPDIPPEAASSPRSPPIRGGALPPALGGPYAGSWREPGTVWAGDRLSHDTQGSQ